MSKKLGNSLLILGLSALLSVPVAFADEAPATPATDGSAVVTSQDTTTQSEAVEKKVIKKKHHAKKKDKATDAITNTSASNDVKDPAAAPATIATDAAPADQSK